MGAGSAARSVPGYVALDRGGGAAAGRAEPVRGGDLRAAALLGVLDHFGVLYREHQPERRPRSRASCCSPPASRSCGSSKRTVTVTVTVTVMVSNCYGGDAGDRLVGQPVERLDRQLEVLLLRVLELRVREAAQALDEQHHRRHAGARDLGRVVQRPARQPVRLARRPRGSTRRRARSAPSSNRIGSMFQIRSHSTSMSSSCANRRDAAFALLEHLARACPRRGAAGRAGTRRSRPPT